MPDTTISDALRFPQDEGISTSIADGHETWPSAGYLSGLAEAAGSEPFVRTGLTFSNHDGGNDEVDVASGRAFVFVDSVDVQAGLGGSSAPAYDRTLSDRIPIMLELPTGGADLSVSSGELNPVWLAYATDGQVGGVEAGDVYLRHGSGETEPPHPSVKLGETNPADATADTRASDGPALDARSATIDEATINRLAAALDANGQDVTGVGEFGAKSVTTDKLVIGGTLYEEDDNSPINVSGQSSVTYTLADSADTVLVRADPNGGVGYDQLQVNGDTGSNYDYTDTSDNETTGATEWPFNRFPANTKDLQIEASDSWVRATVDPRDSGTAFNYRGENGSASAPITQFTLKDSSGSNWDLKARVYRRVMEI